VNLWAAHFNAFVPILV